MSANIKTMKDYARTFYTSGAWVNCREAYRKSVGGLCESCRDAGRIRAGAIVHHLTPITPENINDPNITLNWKNLRFLCRDCHAAVHGYTKKRWHVDDSGRVSPRGA